MRCGRVSWHACCSKARRVRTPAADCTIWERLARLSCVKASPFPRIFTCRARTQRSFFEGARCAHLLHLSCWCSWCSWHSRSTKGQRPAARDATRRVRGRASTRRGAMRCALCASTAHRSMDFWLRSLGLMPHFWCQHARRTAYILPAGSCMGQLSALALSPHWSMAVDCATTRCKDRDRHSRTCRLAFWQAEAAWVHSTVANLQCIQCSSSTSRRRADLRPVCGRLMTDRKRRNVRIQPSNRAHASPHAHRVHILTAAFVSRSRTATAPV